MKLYIASPLGFSEVGRAFYEGILVPEIMRLGFEVLDPWKLADQSKLAAVLSMPYGEGRVRKSYCPFA